MPSMCKKPHILAVNMSIVSCSRWVVFKITVLSPTVLSLCVESGALLNYQAIVKPGIYYVASSHTSVLKQKAREYLVFPDASSL